MTTVIAPLPGAGLLARAGAWLRGLRVRRLVARLTGGEPVVIEGHVFVVRPRPIRACRDLVPALIRCSRRFAAWEIDEALYDDLVQVLALGLNAPPATVERLTVSLFDLSPVIDVIARVNGLPVVEAGRADLGEFLATMAKSTGMSSWPASSSAPAGPGTTSSIH